MIERRGGKPVATFLMFDEKTEELAKEIGLDVWFPPAKLRQRCDNKMETVRIGNKAGVPSVPNALAKVDSYEAPAADLPSAPSSATTWWCSRPSATPATPPSSSPARTTSTSTRTRSSTTPRSRS